MYNGFIPTVSKKILDAIELSTLAELVNENHDNLYWQGRLEAKRQQMEIARDDAWLNSESDREGTEPSPIISGGEVLYITNPTGNDDIPF